MELRQFIYLNDLAIQTLLASAEIAAPESITETQEEIHEGGKSGRIKAGVSIPWAGEVSGNADLSKSETGREVLEANKRIDDQYLFSMLHGVLEEQNKIKDFTQDPDSIDIEMGDVIKIKGEAHTDPIYRILSILTIIDELDSDEELGENFEQMDQAIDLLYADQVGLSLEVENTISSFGMSLDLDNLWVDEKREFLGDREYIVLGRAREQFGRQKKWDYSDLMRLGDTIVSDETMDDIRELLEQFAESIGEMSETYEAPDMEEATIEEIQEDDYTSQESAFSLDIEDVEISIEGPGFVVSPIAIYW